MTKEEQRAYDRERYRKNAEQFRAEARRRYHADPERSRRRQRERHREDPRRGLLNNARERAKRGGLPFDLQLHDIVIPARCPILGLPLAVASSKSDNSPSLDRIVPEKGYVRGNVAVISDRANRIKNNGTATEHRLIADWIDAQ